MTDNDFPCCAPEKGHAMTEATNDQSPAELSPLDGLPGVGDLLRSDPARVARWEYLVQNTASYWPRQKAEAAMRLADEERAALVAEVERLQEAADESSSLYAQWRDDCAARAEAAEAKLAKVEAAHACSVERMSTTQAVWNLAYLQDDLRAAFADAPAEQRAEPCPLDAGARPYWMGVDQYDSCKCLLTKGHVPPCVCSHTAEGDGRG